MRVPRIIAAGVLVLVPAALVTLSVRRDKRLSTGFERISVGMSQGEVFELMGSPRSSGDCDRGFVASHRANGCVEADLCAVSFAPLDPEYWVVYLDGHKRVIDKGVLQSP
jgi:hypothetical protein